jgi:hypothetical protein
MATILRALLIPHSLTPKKSILTVGAGIASSIVETKAESFAAKEALN